MGTRKSKPLSLSIENVGDSCYLQDHHNRPRESLLYLSFSGGESVADIRAEIEREIADCDKIPACRVASCAELDLIANEIAAEMAIAEADGWEPAPDDCDIFEETSWDVQVLASW